MSETRTERGMSEIVLNRTRVELTPVETWNIEDRDLSLTPGLWCASADDAVLYGGEVTRFLVGECPIRNDRKHVVVDVKVHMLMKGMWPAIPGWHTDGVPRVAGGGCPIGPEPPDLARQESLRSPRYHLIVFGEARSQTRFVRDRNVLMDLPASTDLYAEMTRQVAIREDLAFFDCPTDGIATWDWWEIHSATPAEANGWRYLLRVTETDYLEPQSDLRKVIRTQQQAYSTEAFGW